MRLILFDVDGTLLHTGPQVRPILASCLEEVYGSAGPMDTFDFSGKTDPQIVCELMAEVGLPREEVWPELDRVRGLFRERLEAGLVREGMTLLPRVIEVLDHLTGRDDAHVGLLTGNWEVTGRIKLSRFDLNRYFAFGAFGDDGDDRRDLVPAALKRAETVTGRRFAPEEALIVGDSVGDVVCARAHGVACLAVTTGWTSAEALREAGADRVVEGLEPGWFGEP